MAEISDGGGKLKKGSKRSADKTFTMPPTLLFDGYSTIHYQGSLVLPLPNLQSDAINSNVIAAYNSHNDVADLDTTE